MRRHLVRCLLRGLVNGRLRCRDIGLINCRGGHRRGRECGGCLMRKGRDYVREGRCRFCRHRCQFCPVVKSEDIHSNEFNSL